MEGRLWDADFDYVMWISTCSREARKKIDPYHSCLSCFVCVVDYCPACSHGLAVVNLYSIKAEREGDHGIDRVNFLNWIRLWLMETPWNVNVNLKSSTCMQSSNCNYHCLSYASTISDTSHHPRKGFHHMILQDRRWKSPDTWKSRPMLNSASSIWIYLNVRCCINTHPGSETVPWPVLQDAEVTAATTHWTTRHQRQRQRKEQWWCTPLGPFKVLACSSHVQHTGRMLRWRIDTLRA